MVAGAITGNISPEATHPFGNIFADATRGGCRNFDCLSPSNPCGPYNESVNYSLEQILPAGREYCVNWLIAEKDIYHAAT